jgi:signal transduction histidine kinase
MTVCLMPPGRLRFVASWTARHEPRWCDFEDDVVWCVLLSSQLCLLCGSMQQREADIRGQLQQIAETIRTEVECITERQDKARGNLEDRMNQVVVASAAEVLDNAQAQHAAADDALREEFEGSAGRLQTNIDELAGTSACFCLPVVN